MQDKTNAVQPTCMSFMNAEIQVHLCGRPLHYGVSLNDIDIYRSLSGKPYFYVRVRSL